jgi:hypothetical protein
MTRTFAAVAVAALVSLAPPFASPVQARDGGAIAAGVLGGLAAGAIIGSAVARPAPPPVYYAPPPPAPMVQEECWYERSRVWDPYAGVWRRGPRRMICE